MAVTSLAWATTTYPDGTTPIQNSFYDDYFLEDLFSVQLPAICSSFLITCTLKVSLFVYFRFLYFFNSTIFEYSNTTAGTKFSIRVCVKSCPGTTLYTVEEVVNFTAITGSSLCKYGAESSDYGANDSYGFPVCPPLPVYKQ